MNLLHLWRRDRVKLRARLRGFDARRTFAIRSRGTHHYSPCQVNPTHRKRRDELDSLAHSSATHTSTSKSRSVGSLALALLSCCALLMSAIACGGERRDYRGDPEGITGPRLDVDTAWCYTTPSKCLAIYRGILHLQSHSNPDCVDLGDRAYGRFYGDAGNFQDHTAPTGQTYQMGVVMNYTGGGWSGHEPANGDILVSQHFNSSNPDGAIGGLIAHEEMHHQGYRHTYTTGSINHDLEIYEKQSACTV